MRFGDIETCRLIKQVVPQDLNSGLSDSKVHVLSLLFPCHLHMCSFTPGVFVGYEKHSLIPHRVFAGLEAEFAVRESPQHTCWECGIRPCCSTKWNVWNHDLHPQLFSHCLFADYFWGPWSFMSNAHQIPTKAAYSCPCFCGCSLHPLKQPVRFGSSLFLAPGN